MNNEVYNFLLTTPALELTFIGVIAVVVLLFIWAVVVVSIQGVFSLLNKFVTNIKKQIKNCLEKNNISEDNSPVEESVGVAEAKDNYSLEENEVSNTSDLSSYMNKAITDLLRDYKHKWTETEISILSSIYDNHFEENLFKLWHWERKNYFRKLLDSLKSDDVAERKKSLQELRFFCLNFPWYNDVKIEDIVAKLNYSNYDTSLVEKSRVILGCCMGKEDKYYITGEIYNSKFSKPLSALDQRAIFSVNKEGISNSPCSLKQLAAKYLANDIIEYGYIKPELVGYYCHEKKDFPRVKIDLHDAKIYCKEILKDFCLDNKRRFTSWCENVASSIQIKQVLNSNKYYICVELAGEVRCVEVEKYELTINEDGLVTRDSAYRAIAKAFSHEYNYLKYGDTPEANNMVEGGDAVVDNMLGYCDTDGLGYCDTEEAEKMSVWVDKYPYISLHIGEDDLYVRPITDDSYKIALRAHNIDFCFEIEKDDFLKYIARNLSGKFIRAISKMDLFRKYFLTHEVFGVENMGKIFSLYYSGFPVNKLCERYNLSSGIFNELREIYGYRNRDNVTITDVEEWIRTAIREDYLTGNHSIEELKYSYDVPYPILFKILSTGKTRLDANVILPNEVFTDFFTFNESSGEVLSQQEEEEVEEEYLNPNNHRR